LIDIQAGGNVRDYRLSARLSLVADWVTRGCVVADVGTDHGYLPIYLAMQGICCRAIAMDVRKKPLERAKANIEQFHVADRIEIRLSDGMDALLPMEAEVVTICGMGGKLMCDILRRGRQKVNPATQFILAPQSELRSVRIFMAENGIEILREHMIKEGQQFYVVMDCRWRTIHEASKSQEGTYYSDLEEMNFRYGKYLLDSGNDYLYEMLLHDKNIAVKILQQVKEAMEERRLDEKKAVKKIQEIQRELHIIGMAMDKYKKQGVQYGAKLNRDCEGSTK